MDKDKIWKMVVILAAIVVIASSLSRLSSRNSLSLSEYAALHTASNGESSSAQEDEENISSPASEGEDSASSPTAENAENASQLTGASLNGVSCLEERVLLEEGFYYEPISDKLERYMTGISYPAATETDSPLQKPNLDNLRYVHILHYDLDGNPTEGELVCNADIAQDLLEIFYELYRNEYKLEKVLLIDEYNGDEAASAEDNNSYCFRWTDQEDSHAARHAQGLAVDINPFYNPYVSYTQDGAEQILPASSAAYADRSVSFPYKIDENDLCYKLFIRHGFIWGGNWNDAKGFQHFQKNADQQ